MNPRLNRIAAAARDGSRVTTVRASSWGSLFSCAYRWEGEHILGIRKASGLRAQLGTAVHASTAAFDTGRIGGMELSVDEAADVFVQTLHNPDREVDFRADKLTLREAEIIGLNLHTMYCEMISPQFNFLSVEQTLEPLFIDCGGGEVVKLTGSMDRARVAETQDGVVIPDVKTGSRVISDGEAQTKGRSAQLGTYQLLYEHTTGIPTKGGQILALATSKRPEVAVSKVWDAKPVMLGTDKAAGLIEIAAAMFSSGLFPPNPQSPMCSDRYCARWATCHYREA